MTPAQAKALERLAHAAGEELPEVAVDALVAGLEAPSLRVLAALPPARLARAAGLADRALQELGHRSMVTLPPAREAALWAEAITAGAVRVLQGVTALGALLSRSQDGALRVVLAGLVADGQRWQRSTGERRPAIERQLVDRARVFLDRWPAS